MKPSRHAGIPLAIVLCLVTSGCLVGVVDVDVTEHSRDSEASRSSTWIVPVSGQLRLRVVGVNGSVDVVGTPDVGAVSIRATRRVRSATPENAEAGLANLQVRVVSTLAEVLVETDQPHDADGREYVVDYEITLPRDLAFTGVNANGPVTLEGLRAGVDLRVGNGNATLRDVEASARIALGNGNLEASMVLPEDGEVVFSVGNGTLSLYPQTDVSAKLTARVGNGTISVQGLTVVDPVSEPGRFRGTLGSGTGLIDLTVGNGNIQVKGDRQ